MHCAYVRDENNEKANEINIEGTKQLVELSRKHQLKNIFLSNMSAQPDAVTNYGKQKFALEKFFNSENDLIIRAGLVIWNGGLFKEMCEFIRKRKLIPLIDGSNQPIQTIFVDDLVLAIDTGIEKNLLGTLTIADPTPIIYKGCNTQSDLIFLKF